MSEKRSYYTEVQKKATRKYQKEKAEQVRFWVKKGEKALLQEEAKAQGMSMRRFIVQAVNTMAGRQVISSADSDEEPEEP